MASASGIKNKYNNQRVTNMIRVDEEDPVGELEPSFPHRDVTIKRGKNPEEFYELLTEIGRGKFGTVYQCKEKSTGLELAAKFVSVAKREERRNVEREVDVMRQLQHPRLIQLYDAYDNGKMMCVILELITGGELFERVIDDDFILTEKACTVFMRQICEGIEFIHHQNILHLDMKPENILCLTKSGNRIKIIDFGLARKFDPDKKLQVLFGTPEFVAPEVVNFDQIGFGTDMWSIGVICYVLLSGLSPFMGETDVQTMANVTVAKYDFDDEAFNEISEDAKDFIRQLLVKDKQSRMTAQQCVAHKWLQKRPPIVDNSKSLACESATNVDRTPEELDVAKDNLRLFVERWNEHPNSPYLFDVSTHEITPCASLTKCNGLDRVNSQQSIGGCSPSPCSSLSSLTESIMGNGVNSPNLVKNEPEDDVFQYSSVHGLERRASDSSCFINKKADVCRRVNLAEEIKKLSDHLYLLSTMNTDLVNNNVTIEKSVTDDFGNSSQKSVSYSCSVTHSTNVRKQSTTTFENHTSESDNKNGTFINKMFSSSFNKKGTNGVSDSKESSLIKNNGFDEERAESGLFSNLPWIKRKFKVSHMSRDVPLAPERKKSIFGIEFNKRREKIDKFAKAQNDVDASENAKSKQKYYKKTDVNGDVKENANNTKDLLLHLLDEWGESQTTTTNFHSGRHKSVSMEWSEAESLATKSMNSVNTFFKRQSSINANGKKTKEIISACGFK